MSFDELSSENIMLFAVKSYDKPNCIMSEFKEDMKRFNYLKRLFYRHRKVGEIKQQLIMNHLMVLYNVFGVEAATRLLFYKIAKEDYPALKTYLLFLSCMPEKIKGIKGHDIISSEIPVDMKIANILRDIK
jgi:5'(3')-deoxyribonucleotidase